MNDRDLAMLSALSYLEKTHEYDNHQALLTATDGELVVAFRGTQKNMEDILTDIRYTPWYDKNIGSWCHKGFLVAARELFQHTLLPEHIKEKCTGRRVTLTGHSLGGAIACIFAAMLAKFTTVHVARITTFGAPRPGYRSLKRHTRHIAGNRYVLGRDPVPHVPPLLPVTRLVLPYKHDRDEKTLPAGDGPIWYDHQIQRYIDALSN